MLNDSRNVQWVAVDNIEECTHLHVWLFKSTIVYWKENKFHVVRFVPKGCIGGQSINISQGFNFYIIPT